MVTSSVVMLVALQASLSILRLCGILLVGTSVVFLLGIACSCVCVPLLKPGSYVVNQGGRKWWTEGIGDVGMAKRIQQGN